QKSARAARTLTCPKNLPVRLAPQLAQACSLCPIQNSEFKIQNSPPAAGA
ncbi:hypothetical protein HMPREF9075_01590, partial [Capnocytophaga sp. oral taxon 332 str. F0381]